MAIKLECNIPCSFDNEVNVHHLYMSCEFIVLPFLLFGVVLFAGMAIRCASEPT